MAKHQKKPEARVEDKDATLADGPIVRGNVNRKTTRSQAFLSFYANDVQIQTTPWDMRFTFGEISVSVGDEVPSANVLELGEVRVSLQLAKRVLAIMSQQIDAYEARFGTIPQPKD